MLSVRSKEERGVGHTFDKKLMMMEEYQQLCFDHCFLRNYPGGESMPVMVGRENKTKIAHVVP